MQARLISKITALSLNRIISYVENKKEFLENKFGITKIPSKPTLSRVLNMAGAGKVTEIITGIMKESIEDTGSVVAVDGKSIRGTAEKGKPHPALQVLTAYCTESSVVLGQEAIHEKTNETLNPCIPGNAGIYRYKSENRNSGCLALPERNMP